MSLTIMFMVLAEFRLSRKVRGWGDKDDHHSSPEHNPESTRNRYSPESRQRAVESNNTIRNTVRKTVVNTAVVPQWGVKGGECVCVCVCFSHSFWTSSSLDVPAGVTQEEGHTGFFIHLLSAVRALIFLARRIQPFLSLVDREVEFWY